MVEDTISYESLPRLSTFSLLSRARRTKPSRLRQRTDKAMADSDCSLDSLRRQIDLIDDRMHDLIMERCALVEQIGGLKANEPVALRPGREAEILRRLVARHSGPFPKAALVRIWREMIGALVGLQKPLTIAVAQADATNNLVELARNHFGVVCPVTVNASAGQVVKMVADGQAGIGVVPLPGRGKGAAEAWWVALTAEREGMPRVVTRLPVCPAECMGGRPDPVEALVIAARPHDQTGQDRTLVAVETPAGVSRDRVRAALATAGFEPTETLDAHNVGGMLQHLIEVTGWLGAGDPRLAQAVRDPIGHICVVGGYPVSLSTS